MRLLVAGYGGRDKFLGYIAAGFESIRMLVNCQG